MELLAAGNAQELLFTRLRSIGCCHPRRTVLDCSRSESTTRRRRKSLTLVPRLFVRFHWCNMRLGRERERGRTRGTNDDDVAAWVAALLCVTNREDPSFCLFGDGEHSVRDVRDREPINGHKTLRFPNRLCSDMHHSKQQTAVIIELTDWRLWHIRAKQSTMQARHKAANIVPLVSFEPALYFFFLLFSITARGHADHKNHK